MEPIRVPVICILIIVSALTAAQEVPPDPRSTDQQAMQMKQSIYNDSNMNVGGAKDAALKRFALTLQKGGAPAPSDENFKLADFFRVSSAFLKPAGTKATFFVQGCINLAPPRKEWADLEDGASPDKEYKKQLKLIRDDLLSRGLSTPELVALYNELSREIARLQPLLYTIRTAQDDNARFEHLGIIDRTSLCFGASTSGDTLQYLGLSHMINPNFGFSVGFAFNDAAKSKGRLTFGVTADLKLINQMLGLK